MNNLTASPNPSPPSWAVVNIPTKNGPRIGILEEGSGLEGIEGIEIIAKNLPYHKALKLSKQYARENKIDEYDNVTDIPYV